MLLLAPEPIQDRYVGFVSRESRSDNSKGMQLHLYTILPATFLACLQFVPVIRHKLLLFHRLNGYIVVVLTQISSAGVLM
jgi:uncharacterized membrane protein